MNTKTEYTIVNFNKNKVNLSEKNSKSKIKIILNEKSRICICEKSCFLFFENFFLEKQLKYNHSLKLFSLQKCHERIGNTILKAQ